MPPQTSRTAAILLLAAVVAAGIATGPSAVARTSEPIPAKVYRYAQRLIARDDLDGDGELDRLEWGRTWGFLITDADMDGRIDLEELVRRITDYGRHRKIRLMPPVGEAGTPLPPLLNPTTDSKPDADKSKTAEDDRTSDTDAQREASGDEMPRRDTRFVVSRARRPGNLPSWFATRDADGDGQLSMAEYAPKPTAATLAEFARYDHDGDGVITSVECLRAVKSSGEKKAGVGQGSP